MSGRGFIVLAGAAVLVTPLLGSSMPADAAGTSAVRATAVPASRCFPSTDNGDPVLRTFDITPRAVDSRGGPQDVTFTATAEDTGGPGAATGVTEGTVYVSTEPGDTANWNLSAPMTPDGHGGLTGTLAVLTEFRTATRYVSISLTDADGNGTSYTTDDLDQLGLPTTFTTTTTPALAPPAVRTVHLSSGTIDTRRHQRFLTLRVRATDDSGVTSGRIWLWGSPIRSSVGHPRRVSGTAMDGVWLARIRVPRWQGNSLAKLAIELTDTVGNTVMFGPKRLAAIKQPGRVRVVSGTEPAPPSLRLLSVRPSSVDLAGGPQRVTFTVRITDRGSGARHARLDLNGPNRDQGEPGHDITLDRVSGTSHDGVWKGSVTLDPCADVAGVWQGTVFAWDAAQGSYIGTPDAVRVANTDIERPEASLPGFGAPLRPAGPITVTFTEDVVGVTAENTVLHIGRDRRGLAGDDPLPIAGTWACSTSAGAAVDCASGPVRTARFTPTVPLTPGTNHTLVLNPEHHLGLTDLAGNPFSPMRGLGFETS